MSVDFDDPLAWGFCKYCAFQVAVDLDTGQMLAHDMPVPGTTAGHTRCYGSLLEPSEQPAPECTPITWQQELVAALTETSNPVPRMEVTMRVDLEK